MFAHPPLKTCTIRKYHKGNIMDKARNMFGLVRRNPDGSPRSHQGIDLASPVGYRVYAVIDGFVIFAGVNGDYGNCVRLAHVVDGKHYYTFYAHLSRIDIEFSATVKAGQQIGLTGDSGNAKGMNTIKMGCHLHFELQNNRDVGKGLAGRLDPMPYLKKWIV